MIRLVALGALILLASCTGTSSDSAATTTTASPFVGPYQAVCDAATAAHRGQPTRARTLFLDGAHQGIHELAATATKRDRPSAGRMLEAKERVEHDLTVNAVPATLAVDLDALAQTVRTAIAATGAPRPHPCPKVAR